MKKHLSIFALSLLLSACVSGEDTQNVEASCDNGIALPSALIGTWERTFERNGSSGVQVLTITSSCTFQDYELGNADVMDEWYTDLSDGITYKFISDPAQEISSVTNEKIYVVNSTGTATITNNKTQDVVAQWNISSVGGYYQYQVTGNTLKLGIESSNTEYSYTKIY